MNKYLCLFTSCSIYKTKSFTNHIITAACSVLVDLQAEARYLPSPLHARQNTSYPCPYNFCSSGHKVFWMSVSSVGGS